MKNIYKTKDIQDFLCSRGVFWNGISKNKQHDNDMVLADALISNTNGYINTEIYLQVSNANFKVFIEDCSICYEETTFYKKLFKDFTYDWINNLIKKYPEKAPAIKEFIDSKMQEEHSYYEKQITPLQHQINQIKEKQNASLNEWKKLKNLTARPQNPTAPKTRTK